ncbi:MAG: XTP/dITP diphosphatase [Candidatus Zixiibacteriota bacterium]|nr:MAG: XTP/dITP diphosphatase [candidate division Zixibacteria bacterium]
MKLVLATNNRDKIAEIKRLLADLPVTILTREDFADFPDPEEDGQTLEANAIIKAKAIYAFTGLPALADDSGLEVDALNGAPGIRSSRYAGPNATYADNCAKLLDALADVPSDKRTARFRCVVALCWAEDDIETVAGIVEGVITTDRAGDKGFGYDPVFYYPPLKKRFAELSPDEKNRVSHRGRALQKARALITKRLESEQ